MRWQRLFRGGANLEWLFFGLILAVFLVNATYVSYPDEFVNLLGGRAIANGLLPYRDFFDHHLPFAWSLAAVLIKLTFGHFTLFRLAYALFAFLLMLGVALHIRKTNPGIYPYYRFFFFLYPFFTVYFWLHLFIADGLACLFFSLSFWLTINETLQKKSNLGILLMSTFLNFSLLFSSLTFIYITFALYLWQGYLILRDHRNTRDIIAFLLVSFLPYGYYLVQLLATGTFRDFWISNYEYNAKHYVHIKNYTPGRFFDPFKLGGAIVYNFYTDYLPLLTTIKHFDLYLPILTLSAWSTFCTLIVLFFRDKAVFIFYFFILSFSAPRSNIDKYSETDYQMGMFITLGMISALLVLYLHKDWKLEDKILEYLKNGAMMVVALLLLFTTAFLIQNTYDKAYQRYTGFMPGISSHSFVSNFFDEILLDGEVFWIGPYEPHHEYPVEKGRLPGKFPTLLPQFRESDYFSAEFIKQFESNPPVMLVFKHEASVFATPADQFGRFFLNWMKGKYITVEEIEGYQQLKSPVDFNLKGDLYIRIDKQEEILNRLEAAGYVSGP